MQKDGRNIAKHKGEQSKQMNFEWLHNPTITNLTLMVAVSMGEGEKNSLP